MVTQIIDFLKKYTDGKQNTEKVEISVLQLNRVIKALEQESCEDAISRQAAQAKIKNICAEYRLSYEDGERKTATGGSAYALGHAFDDLPPVTPTHKRGATNGDVIKAVFPNVKTKDYDNFISYTFNGIVGNIVEKSWWNAPYERESEK